MNNFFSKDGQINASSLADLSVQLGKYAALMQDNVPSNTGLASQSLSDSARDDLISRAIFNNDGKVALAQAMANPIRRNLDYHGIARRALVVDPLI